MRNSPGYLMKTLSLCSVILVSALFFIFFSTLSSASSENQVAGFDQYSSITYTVNKDGTLNSEIELTVIPQDGASNVVKFFSLQIPFTNVSALEVKRADKKFTISSKEERGNTKVTVDANNLVIDRDKGATFRITFKIEQYVQPREILSLPLYVPSTTVRNAKIILVNPYHQLVAPQLANMTISEQNNSRVVNIQNPSVRQIGFHSGSKFVYEYSINRTFYNGDNIDKSYEVNIPKVYPGQRVLITKVSTAPSRVIQDIEGNLSVRYNVPAGSEMKVSIKGLISIEDENEEIDFDQYDRSISGQGYWKIEDETELKRIDLYIKNSGLTNEFNRDARLLSTEDRQKLARTLYSYTLDRLGGAVDLDISSTYRQGSKVLEDPTTASASDYNDFLIALLRKYCVPARLVQGYVANSSEIFDDGFMHSWVEIWVDGLGWVTADPVVESVTSLSMYNPQFSDHITFLTRSHNPFRPQLGFFLDEDVEIKISNQLFAEILSVKTSQRMEEASLLKPNSEARFIIENDGNSIVRSVQFAFDEGITANSLSREKELLIFPSQKVEVKGSITLKSEDLKNKRDSSAITGNLVVKSIYDTNRSYVLEDSVTIKHYWWWDTFVKLISLLLFLIIAIISVNAYKLIWGSLKDGKRK